MESLKGLENNLIEQGHKMEELPIVMQWNKRDLPNSTSVEDLEQKLNKWSSPTFEAVANDGEGVFETLKMISKLVLMNVKGNLH